jgi:sugar phosphate isomerase/epimerase
MIRSAITISLVPEARGGPFVYWDGLEDGCAQAAAAGFDAVEIFPSSAAELDAAALHEMLEWHHLSVAAIGTGAGWVVHRLRLTDPDPSVRRRAVEFVGEVIDFAAGFGAPAIIGSMQGRAEGEVSRELALEWLAEALEALGARSGAHGVPLIYEPLNRYETNLVNTVAEGVALLARLNHSHVRLLCDCFHMNIEEASIAAALKAAGPLVGHVHFADSNRRAAGLGHTDFTPIAEALREIGYSGYVAAEILPLPDAATAADQTMRAFRQAFPRP